MLLGILAVMCCHSPLSSHCQMPCGIYHDDMVYDQIDQYVETMFKGITMLTDTKFSTTREKNEFVRWVINKETGSDDVAHIITQYFLQQKIKPGEDDTVKRLTSAHRLLFLLVQIKQNTDRKIVEDFADEWEKFKLMFHVEGYECQIESIKMRKRQELESKQKKETPDDHDHDHDGDHEHPHK